MHVEYLARELARLVDVTVHCWGDDRPAGRRRAEGRRAPGLGRARAGPRRTWPRSRRCRSTWRWRRASRAPTLVHSHTWYANLGGHLAKLIHGIPHVATVHSLEPMRPWKEEQLGGGYAVSTFCERTVARGGRRDHRRLGGDAPRRARVLPGDRPGARARDLQRDRHRGVPARSGNRRARAPRHRPGAAVGRLRRPDHAAEGPHLPARRGARARPGRAARPLRGRAGHARDRRGDRGQGRAACGPSAETWSGSRRCSRSAR